MAGGPVCLIEQGDCHGVELSVVLLDDHLCGLPISCDADSVWKRVVDRHVLRNHLVMSGDNSVNQESNIVVSLTTENIFQAALTRTA